MKNAGFPAIFISLIALYSLGAVPQSQPATQPSREEESLIRTIQCMDNLRFLAKSMVVYASNNGDKFPPDLGALLVAENIDMSRFVCPAAANALPANWQKMPRADQAKWVNAHSDYVFLTAGKIMDLDAQTPILYDKDINHPNGFMQVAFGDGHVELLKLADVQKRFGAKAGTERATTPVKPAPGQAPSIPLITMDAAKGIYAGLDMGTLASALMSFKLDNGRLPTSQEGLGALVKKPAGNLPDWHQYVPGLPKDPWGHDYIYTVPGKAGDYDLSSAGADGKPGTADDVTH